MEVWGRAPWVYTPDGPKLSDQSSPWEGGTHRLRKSSHELCGSISSVSEIRSLATPPPVGGTRPP